MRTAEPPIARLLVDAGLLNQTQVAALQALQAAGDNRSVAEVIVELGFATPEDLDRFVSMVDPVSGKLALPQPGAPIGRILIEAGLITIDQLQALLALQRAGDQRRLGDVLVDLGYVGRDELEAVFSAGLGATPLPGLELVAEST